MTAHHITPSGRRVTLNVYVEKGKAERAAYAMDSLIRSMRGGKDYDAEFGKRMKGSGPYAWQISRRFEIAAKKLGLSRGRSMTLNADLFVPPSGHGVQLSLL